MKFRRWVWAGAGLAAVGGAAVLRAKRARAEREIDGLERRLDVTGTGAFDPASVASLPASVRRYLEHAIAPGTPLAARAWLRMHGWIRLQPGGEWQRFRATQTLAPLVGFVWWADVDMTPARVRGADYYVDGQAATRFWALRLLPIVSGESADIALSAAGRLVAETVLVPSTLLPSRGVRWSEDAQGRAVATMEMHGHDMSVALDVDPTGRLRAVTLDRWSERTPHGQFGWVPFRVVVDEEQTVGGYTVPARFSAIWGAGTERPFEFMRARVSEVVFT